MRPIKSIAIVLLAAILLSGCQLFEPLPTLPVVLTLPPLDTEALPVAALPGITPEAMVTQAPASLQVSPTASTQALTASSTPAVVLPASPTSSQPTQAATLAPSATGRPTNPPAATATRPAPTTASAAAWHDVPIMPGFVDGKEEEGSYSYTVSASISDVQSYYDRTMPLAGWQPLASGVGEEGNLLLMYQKNNTTATIGVIAQGGSTLVLIVTE